MSDFTHDHLRTLPPAPRPPQLSPPARPTQPPLWPLCRPVTAEAAGPAGCAATRCTAPPQSRYWPRSPGAVSPSARRTRSRTSSALRSISAARSRSTIFASLPTAFRTSLSCSAAARPCCLSRNQFSSRARTARIVASFTCRVPSSPGTAPSAPARARQGTPRHRSRSPRC